MIITIFVVVSSVGINTVNCTISILNIDLNSLLYCAFSNDISLDLLHFDSVRYPKHERYSYGRYCKGVARFPLTQTSNQHIITVSEKSSVYNLFICIFCVYM